MTPGRDWQKLPSFNAQATDSTSPLDATNGLFFNIIRLFEQNEQNNDRKDLKKLRNGKSKSFH
jgi:hypothetical protein